MCEQWLRNAPRLSILFAVSACGGDPTNASNSNEAGGTSSTGASTGGTAGALGSTGGVNVLGGGASTGGASRAGGTKASGGVSASGGASTTSGGTRASGGVTATGGGVATGGAPSSGGTTGGLSATGGTSSSGSAQRPFPQDIRSPYCTYPSNARNDDVVTAYEQWKTAVVTADGAGGYLRIKKPDSGSVIGSTVSEGIGYGMILAVYMGDQSLFDNLWKYEQSHLDGSGLMNWEIGPDNLTTSGGSGAATDGDEDMAWALIMADRQWGGKGSLGTPI